MQKYKNKSREVFSLPKVMGKNGIWKTHREKQNSEDALILVDEQGSCGKVREGQRWWT